MYPLHGKMHNNIINVVRYRFNTDEDEDEGRDLVPDLGVNLKG